MHNVFVAKDGIWRTPPISCGLLPGTCRAQILRERLDACEAVLTLDDLVHAESIYLCNSVPEMYRVRFSLERLNRAPRSASAKLGTAQIP